MSGPRVALVTRQYWPLANGPEESLAELAKAWAERGVDVTVVSARWHPQWPNVSDCAGVRVMRIPYPPVGSQGRRRWLKFLAAWFEEHREAFDVVVVSGLGPEAATAVDAARQGKFAVALRPEYAGRHGDVFSQLESRGARKARAYTAKADALLAATPAIERELIAAGFARDRIHPLYYGVPPTTERTAQDRVAARLSLGQCDLLLALPEETPVAVYCGPLEPQHGVGVLVESWRTVVDQVINARLWLVGSGSMRPELAARADELQLYGRIAAAGQFDDIDDFCRAADVLLAPSPEHGATWQTLRAMACGMPVIAADIEGNRDVIAPGETGLLVPRADERAWGEAVVQVLSQPNKYTELGRRAAAFIRDRFPLARMADLHLELFERLVSRVRS